MPDASATLLSPLSSRALARVLISGYVDAYALLNFGVYASFMTGNTTSGGLYAGQGNLATAGHSLLPIPFFLFGILAGTPFVQIARHTALRRISLLVATLLALAVARNYFAWPEWLGIVLLSTAMGILNTSVTQVGGQPQGASDTHWRRTVLLGSLWTCFFVRAILGAALSSRVAVWTLLFPAGLLLLLALLEPASATAD